MAKKNQKPPEGTITSESIQPSASEPEALSATKKIDVPDDGYVVVDLTQDVILNGQRYIGGNKARLPKAAFAVWKNAVKDIPEGM